MRKLSIGIVLGCSIVCLLFLLSNCPMPAHPQTYTVIFDTDGGSSVDAQYIQESTKATRPDNPTKSGYTFAGWYKESAYSNEWVYESDVVVSNITLYARWTADDHALGFDTNGGTGSMDEVSLVTDEETTLRANAFTRLGYTFTGWASTSDGDVVYADKASFTMGPSDVTLYARWRELMIILLDSIQTAELAQWMMSLLSLMKRQL